MNRDQALEKIGSYRDLGDNWDTYGSPAFAPVFLVDVAAVLDLLDDDAFPTLHISPFPGGVQFEWHADGRFLEVSFHEDMSLSWLWGAENDEAAWRDGWATDWTTVPSVVAAHQPSRVAVR